MKKSMIVRTYVLLSCFLVLVYLEHEVCLPVLPCNMPSRCNLLRCELSVHIFPCNFLIPRSECCCCCFCRWRCRISPSYFLWECCVLLQPRMRLRGNRTLSKMIRFFLKILIFSKFCIFLKMSIFLQIFWLSKIWQYVVIH